MSLLLPTDLELNIWGMLWTERGMILCILQQTPRAELWRLGDASVLGVWLRRNCSTAVPAGTLLKSHGKTWPWSAQLSAAEANVEVCTVVKVDSKLVQDTLLQGNAWHILVSTPNLLPLTQSLMNHCHSVNTCESAKVNGIRPRIEQCGMLYPLLLHSSAAYPLLFKQQQFTQLCPHAAPHLLPSPSLEVIKQSCIWETLSVQKPWEKETGGSSYHGTQGHCLYFHVPSRKTSV